MTTIAEQRKVILPYLQRANEIEILNPKVAYYCRYYAIQRGLQVTNRLPDFQQTLEDILEKMEVEKPNLNINPQDDAPMCEAFAITVFNRADKQDRAGNADAKLVKAFYVSALFIEILEQFGELAPDMVERRKYAAWKAADIRKALREGRVPTAGPPVTADDLDLDLDLPDIPGGADDGRPEGRKELSSTLSSVLSARPSSVLSARPSSVFSARPSNLAAAAALQQRQSKLMPGSRVYCSLPGQPPAKGTVVTITSTPSGSLFKVALSREVKDIPESQLALDLAIGDLVLYQKGSAQASESKVIKVGADQWPVLYLVETADGETVGAFSENLTPLVSNQRQPSSTTEPPGSSVKTRQAPDYVSPAFSHATAPEYKPEFSEVNDTGTGNERVPSPSRASPSRAPDVRRQMPSLPSSQETDYQHPSSQKNVGPAGVAGGFLYPTIDPTGGQPASKPPLSSQPTGSSFQPEPKPSPRPEFVQQPPSQPAQPEIPQNGPARPSQSSNAGKQAAESAPVEEANPAINFRPPLHAITDAQKIAKYAVSSLSFEDVPTAVKYLQQALDLLTKPT